jgi:hypothetical protein
MATLRIESDGTRTRDRLDHNQRDGGPAAWVSTDGALARELPTS